MSAPKYDLMIKAAKKMKELNMPLEMGCYRTDKIDDVERVYLTQESLEKPCGAFGCIIGNMPFTDIPELSLTPNDLNAAIPPKVSWAAYALRVLNISEFDDEFDYLFGPTWPNDYDAFIARVEECKNY